MSEEAKWYAVHTYSGYENKVAATIMKTVENRHMEDLFLDIKIPMETVTEIKETGSKDVERKLFPGYVLIKMVMTDDCWYIVRNTRGVTSFVGPGSKPVALTDAEVAKLGVEKIEIRLNYDVGDNVKIINGPLEGFTGIVDEIDKASKTVKVTVSMFGRETPVELEFHQIASMGD